MNKPRNLDQSGVVSIMVTMILMLVITLIVMGFAQVSRRNAREALDRQLSSQAYYAAEAGINDVVTALNTPGLITQANMDANKYTNNCGTLITDITANPKLNSDGTVAYSCLLLNSKPRSITYSTIAEQRSVSVPLNLNDKLTKLFFSWNSNGTARTNATTCSGSLVLKNLPTTWGCDYAMLQVDIVQPTTGYNASALSSQTNSYYLRPFGSAVTLNTSTFGNAATKAQLVQSKCVAGVCTAELDFLAGASTQKYSMRVEALYNSAENVQITGNVAGGLPATFSGAQISVDSTGKAQDELRRIQVRLPVQSSDIPPAALQSVGGVCKQFVLGSGLADPAATYAGLCNP